MNNVSSIELLTDKLIEIELKISKPVKRAKTASNGKTIAAIPLDKITKLKKLLKQFSCVITDKTQPQIYRENLFSTFNQLLRTLNNSQRRTQLLLSVERSMILAIRHLAPQKSPEFSHPYALDLILSELPSETDEDRTASLKTIRSFNATAPERVSQWLANWIYKQKIPFYEFCNLGITNIEIDTILPYLKYLDLSEVDIILEEKLDELLQRSINLEVLIVRTTHEQIQLPSSLKVLDCTRSYKLKYLPDKMKNLQVLKCEGCPILSFPKFNEYEHSQLTHFAFETPIPSFSDIIGGQYLQDIDQDKYIKEVNQLLEKSPHLTSLSMEGPSAIIEHIKIPETLKYLRINSKGLKIITYLPQNLCELDVKNCHHLLEILPQLPDTLRKFNCHNCEVLRPLNKLPPSLEFFDCSKKHWKQLPPLPPSLRILKCMQVGLTFLPELPPSLLKLACRRNKLLSLPMLPQSLEELYCADNLLKELPELPDKLHTLDCYNNQLTELPLLPSTLTKLTYGKNPIDRGLEIALN